MKRSPLKRTGFKSRTPLAGGKVNLRRTQLKRVGKRVKREKDALAKFRYKDPEQVIWDRCEECGTIKGEFGGLVETDPHHLVPRSIAAGHPNTHHLGNRAWLCRKCHDDAHAGRLPHLILPRTHLDTLD